MNFASNKSIRTYRADIVPALVALVVLAMSISLFTIMSGATITQLVGLV